MPDESDDEPKSAIELAMERFRKKDAEAGITERPLTDDQRRAIAEARNVFESKQAEIEILYTPKLAAAADPESLEALRKMRQREIERAAGDRDRKIAKIRQG
jgi:hypothetical protein